MIVRFLIAVSCLCGTAVGQQQQPVPAPFFKGDSLPVPPSQNAPWPHGEVALSEAAALLFEQGLADPRGLEYREIEIPIGNPWNGGGLPFKTHGWPLPEEQGRFAVAWNGLVYPLLTIGDLADLDRDWADAEKWAEENRSDRHQHAFEAISVQAAPPTLLKLLLLLRLGKTEIVNKIAPLLQKEGTDDLYMRLAGDWAWFAFERAVCAHERGDDRLCLVDCQLLTRIQPVVEAEAKRREIPQPADDSNSRFPDRKLPYLPFLGQLSLLLEDTERRLAPPQQLPPSENPVAALIDDLQNVDARQDGQPGGVTLAFDPRVQALVKRGDEVVEPLLKTLESDKRLTRSVSFGRDFFRGRHLISVSDAALATLEDLLEVDFQTYRKEDGEPLSRRELAQHIRDYWAKNGRPASHRAFLRDIEG